METEHSTTIESQSGISILLIIAIMVATGFFMTCTYNTEDESFMLSAIACPILALLTGIYTFTYRGKAYLLSRIVFFILLALSLFSLFVLWYFIALGSSYSH
ncbi:hypothetical protein LPB86_18020 [Pedobacter sp. MC2016-14]|uniref:hypothetical protein n=1 Tax=Pedobacter sp. MC2016-14 TaxID=2897327 RepID=UPI001E54B48D|nr:hypothetical protein [Pedobacter sp. MC2016-14]MCD0490143.1 hypothetical protein [Pedobacter sp. MC2016-14]